MTFIIISNYAALSNTLLSLTLTYLTATSPTYLTHIPHPYLTLRIVNRKK